MADQDRAPNHSIEEMLAPKARRFSFFQLVRLLERFHRSSARVGHQGPASAEVLRFRPDISLASASSDVAKLDLIRSSETARKRYRITTTFLGLYGSTSPLPSFYSEEILWTDENQNRIRDFLDLFHHRLISLFYRCWAKYRHHIQFEYGENDRLTPNLFSLIGIDADRLGHKTELLEPMRLLHFAGLVHQQPHSASALEGILSEFFDNLPVEIEQCTGMWVPIKHEQLASLGEKNCRLGMDCSIGLGVFARTGNFRIWIGPINYQQFLDFLPDQPNHRSMHSLVNFFTTDHLEFDIAFKVLQPPPLQLLSNESERSASRLGWTSWLFSESPGKDRKETVVFDRSSLKGIGREVRRSS